MKKHLNDLDKLFIQFSKKNFISFARVALFVVYFWFGLLKVLGFSPAGPLVKDLLERTIPFIGGDAFVYYFGWFEMLTGVIFLIPKLSRVAVFVLFIHLITTAGPLVMLPQIAWQAPFVPTLEGQYIIKNVLIVAAAFAVITDITPWGEKS